jgi:hypothetical protein
MLHRLAQVEASIERYLQQLADADHHEPTEDKSQRLEDQIAALKQGMARLNKVEARMHVLAHNLKRVMNLVGMKPLIEAIRA